jgi:hypothetical protein
MTDDFDSEVEQNKMYSPHFSFSIWVSVVSEIVCLCQRMLFTNQTKNNYFHITILFSS